MFGELIDMIKLAFGLTIVIGIVVIVAGVIRGMNAKARIGDERWKMREDISKIKSASKRWSREQKIHFLGEVGEKYNRLAVCKRNPMGNGYASKTFVLVNIDGDLQMISMDMQGLHEVYCFINETLDE
jgi:hypothetical protein